MREGTVLGYVWQENIGWINLSPQNYGGVSCDSNWYLSGYAWGENVGWINFNPTVPGDPMHYGVSIDSSGNMIGWAWGENIGWIHINSSSPVAYKVRACVVSIDDLAHFSSYWLQSGSLPAELNGSNGVNYGDFRVFAQYWMNFCPDNWSLK
jgi:hypothetical protein